MYSEYQQANAKECGFGVIEDNQAIDHA